MTIKTKIVSATDGDLDVIAKIHREARQESMPWLPDIHTLEEDRWFFRNIVFKDDTILVAQDGGRILGFLAFKDDWLNHLYIAPEHWQHGIGTTLLKAAKEETRFLQLWTFQRNSTARWFYAAHGFEECELTDGQGNEEKKPDVRLEWRGS